MLTHHINRVFFGSQFKSVFLAIITLFLTTLVAVAPCQATFSSGSSFTGTLTSPAAVDYTGRQIYITVRNDSTGATAGNSVTCPAPGSTVPFSVNGLIGEYQSHTIEAFIDQQGTGIRHSSDPYIRLVGQYSNGLSFDLGVLNISAPSLPVATAPSTISVTAGDAAAIIRWESPRDSSGAEVNDGYKVIWSTDPAFATTIGTSPFIPADGNNNYILTGLSNAITYYVAIQGVTGNSDIASYSAASSARTITPFATGTTGTSVSGNLVSPLFGSPGYQVYLALLDAQESNPVKIVALPSAFIDSATVPYAFRNIADGNYKLFAFIDNNLDNRLSIGDIHIPFSRAIPVTVSGGVASCAPASSCDIDLTTYHVGAVPELVTVNWNDLSQSRYGNRLEFTVLAMEKRPISASISGVQLNIGGTITINPDADQGLQGAFEVPVIPATGEKYTVDVTYDDGTSESMPVTVSGFNTELPTNLAPSGTLYSATAPVFTWANTTQPINFSISSTSSNVYYQQSLPARSTSFDSKNINPQLPDSTTYSWGVATVDANGNRAETISGNLYFSYDLLPPTVTLSPVAGTFPSAQYVTLSGYDTTSAIKEFFYTTDDSDPSVSSTRLAVNSYIQLFLPKTANIKYIATDMAGNSTGVITAGYTINDTTKPTVYGTYPVAGSVLQAGNTSLPVSILFSELMNHTSLAGISVTLNGVAVSGFSPTITDDPYTNRTTVTLYGTPFSPLQAGAYVVTIPSTATDLAGLTLGNAYTLSFSSEEVFALATSIVLGSGDFSCDTGSGATTCSTSYPTGTQVSVKAIPNANNTFSGWNGTCTGSINPCTVTVNGPVNIWATFVADTTLGGLPGDGNLAITIGVDGNIGVYRYVSAAIGNPWQAQVFGDSNKGSLLHISGNAYAFGYFSASGAVTADTTATKRINTNQYRSVWTTAANATVSQTITFIPGASYYNLQWDIQNSGSTDLADLRFFHGQDTYFSGSDYGAGFWDQTNTTVGVEKNVVINDVSSVQRMYLQGVTPPYGYESQNYSTMVNDVSAFALKNILNTNQGTDNGYALEWRYGNGSAPYVTQNSFTPAPLAAGATWTIVAYEKFADIVASGGIAVKAPVTNECSAGLPCPLVFTVTNTGVISQTVSLNATSDHTDWSLANSSQITVLPGSSQQVTVTMTAPSTASNGSSGSVTLTVNGSSSDSAAINIIANSVTISTPAPPAATYGDSYPPYQLNASGGTTPYAWGLDGAGTLPAGISLSGSGLLNGTPAVSGSFNVVVSVTSANGVKATAPLTLIVNKGVLTVTPGNASRLYGLANPSFTYAITGYKGNDTAAVVSGSATVTTSATSTSTAGNYPITATSGTLAAANYTFAFTSGVLTITGTPVAVQTPVPPQAGYGTPYSSYQLIASGGTAPYIWFLDATGTLPAGISLSTAGLLSGTPATAGSYLIKVIAKDKNGLTASGQCTLVINKASLMITPDPASRIYGVANPVFTGTITGYKLGDTASVITGTPVFSTVATPSSPVGSYSVTGSVGSLTADNYTFIFANGVLQITPVTFTTGSDGRTTTAVSATQPGAKIDIPAGVTLKDAQGNPLTGTLSMVSTVSSSKNDLPPDAQTGKTSGGKTLSVMGAIIDLTITSGTTAVKTISPALTINLKIPGSFAVPGSTVPYYSYSNGIWTEEGTAIVKADGSIDMTVTHLSLWGAASFVSDLPSGDINGDGTVNLADALLALQISLGFKTATAEQLKNGDVAPLVNPSKLTSGVISATPKPNNVINSGDALVILEKSLGIVTW